MSISYPIPAINVNPHMKGANTSSNGIVISCHPALAFGFELSFVHISPSKNMFSFQFQNKTPRPSIYIK